MIKRLWQRIQNGVDPERWRDRMPLYEPDPVLSEVFCQPYPPPPPPPPLWMRICEKLGLGKAVWVTFGRNKE